MRKFFYLCFIFDFLGATLDKTSDRGAVSRCVGGCMRCGAGGGQRPIASGA
jgi:hypothetical protein